MKIYPFQAIYPNVDLIASPDSFFSSVREDYVQYYQNGFFEESEETAKRPSLERTEEAGVASALSRMG